jgi:hypothetical protein
MTKAKQMVKKAETCRTDALQRERDAMHRKEKSYLMHG